VTTLQLTSVAAQFATRPLWGEPHLWRGMRLPRNSNWKP